MIRDCGRIRDRFRVVERIRVKGRIGGQDLLTDRPGTLTWCNFLKTFYHLNTLKNNVHVSAGVYYSPWGEGTGQDRTG